MAIVCCEKSFTLLPQGKKKKSVVISSQCASSSCMFTEILSNRNIFKEFPFLPLLPGPQPPALLCYLGIFNIGIILMTTLLIFSIALFLLVLKKSFFCHLFSALLCCFNKHSPIMSPPAAAETSVASFFLLCKKIGDSINIYLRW